MTGRFAMRAEIKPTEDFEAIRRLCLASGLEDGSFDRILSAIGCFRGKDLVGCAALKGDNGRFTIDWVAVDESFRRMGIGSMLVSHIEGEARSRGVERLWAVTRAPDFFKQLGYTESSGDVSAPSMENCQRCRQYGTTCSPQVVSKKL